MSEKANLRRVWQGATPPDPFTPPPSPHPEVLDLFSLPVRAVLDRVVLPVPLDLAEVSVRGAGGDPRGEEEAVHGRELRLHLAEGADEALARPAQITKRFFSPYISSFYLKNKSLNSLKTTVKRKTSSFCPLVQEYDFFWKETFGIFSSLHIWNIGGFFTWSTWSRGRLRRSSPETQPMRRMRGCCSGQGSLAQRRSTCPEKKPILNYFPYMFKKS